MTRTSRDFAAGAAAVYPGCPGFLGGILHLLCTVLRMPAGDTARRPARAIECPAAGGGGAAIPYAAGAARGVRRVEPWGPGPGRDVIMEQRPFGRTGLAVSALGFGSWPMSGGDRYGPIEDQEAIRAIHRAIDLGVTCVDTAPAYGFGHAEQVVGQALRGRRDRVILVTKCGLAWDPGSPAIRRDISRASLRREVDACLRRLETDRIDVYLIPSRRSGSPRTARMLPLAGG